jgi:hypothetical protein
LPNAALFDPRARSNRGHQDLRRRGKRHGTRSTWSIFSSAARAEAEAERHELRARGELSPVLVNAGFEERT